jgi:superfamily II DNA or RNA helicase
MPALRRRLAGVPRGINPWSLDTTVVSSFDYIKRPEVLPAVLSCHWDIVVIDEAHGVARGSERHDAVSALCSRAGYVVVITATPHSGDAAAFASICQLGNHGDDPLVFRRTRAQVHVGMGRRVHRLRVRLSDLEHHLHGLLGQFSRAVAADTVGRSREASLVVATLQKRALSSAAALVLSIDRRLDSLEVAPGVPSQMALPLDDEGGEFDAADQPPEWHAALFDDVAEERRWLRALAAATRAAHEPKAEALSRLLRRLRRLGESAIVFTEYRDTLVTLAKFLGTTAALIHGGIRASEREAIVEAFRRGASRCFSQLTPPARV